MVRSAASVPMAARGKPGVARLLFLLMGLLLFASFIPFRPVAAAAVRVQGVTYVNTGNGTSAPLTFTAAKAGNLLIIICSTPGASGSMTVTSTPSVTYTSAKATSGTPSQAIFYRVATGGEANATCNYTRQKSGTITVLEYSGLAATSPLDAVNTVISSGNGTTASSGQVTTVTGRTLLVGVIAATSSGGASGWTSSFTEQTDVSATSNPLLTTATATRTVIPTGTYSTAATITSSAWLGQIAAFKLAPGQLALSIVDGGGNPVASPSINFNPALWHFDCQPANGVLGSSTQKLRITNQTVNSSWNLTIAPDVATGNRWSSGSSFYDVNDPANSGCSDGTDSDSYAGQLAVDPSASAITVVSGAEFGCSASTGLTRGSSKAFSEGVVDSIQLLAAGATAPTECVWDVTNITLTQTIPDGQPEGTYSIGMMITLQNM